MRRRRKIYNQVTLQIFIHTTSVESGGPKLDFSQSQLKKKYTNSTGNNTKHQQQEIDINQYTNLTLQNRNRTNGGAVRLGNSSKYST